LTCHRVNAASKDLIKQWEGFESGNPDDGFGNPTCGYGHACKQKGCTEIHSLGFSLPLSKASAEKLLDYDLTDESVRCLKRALGGKARVNEYEYGMLASLIFNVGCGQFEGHSVQTRINAGEKPSTVIADTFTDYVHANGRVVEGLVNRRNAEIAFAKKPSVIMAYPCP
jgi:GH24 family phage-related lysozyme (muramidase)